MTSNKIRKEEMELTKDIGSNETLSRHSSITNPYRSLVTQSFARCHPTSTPKGGTESFIRSLLPLGNGYPLWNPLGESNRDRLKQGIMIGDVGLITEAGYFRYYFNIFLPATHSKQLQCPPDLEPFSPPLESSEIITNPTHFPPGTALVSKGVLVTRTSESPLDIHFSVKARDSGIIVLPDGASREDLASTSRLHQYVNKHALNWYRFINKVLADNPHPNGCLYIVTGTDKTSEWGLACSPEYSTWSGDKMSIRYERAKGRPWHDVDKIASRASRAADGIPQCAIFIRGMRIAVSPRSWSKYILKNQPPRNFLQYNILSTPTVGIRARIQTKLEHWIELPEDYLSVDTETHFHPLVVIAEILLEESPTSSVAIVEDSMWCSIVDGGDGTLPDVVRLLVQLLLTHVIHTENGLVMLAKISDPSRSKTPFSIQNALLHIPNIFKEALKRRRQHREASRKVAKYFPGSGLE